jgi:hypothetical protein
MAWTPEIRVHVSSSKVSLGDCLVERSKVGPPVWDDVVADAPRVAEGRCPERREINAPLADLKEDGPVLQL